MKAVLVSTTIHVPEVLLRYRELGPDVTFVATDVTQPEQVQAAIDAACARGTLRAAVSCAGVGAVMRTLDKQGQPHDPALLQRVLSVNLFGTFHVLRLSAGTTHSFTVVAVDPSRNASAPSAAVTATTLASTDTAGPAAPGNLYAFDFGCETWLFWDASVDDVDPQAAILYEVRVNGVFDGAAIGIDRWITYGTQSSNTFSVQAIDSAGNRSPASSITLDNQVC